MTQAVRKRPALLRALGDDDPPASVEVGASNYKRERIFKHDSWAATGVYVNDAGARIICKFGRRQPLAILPGAWIGRWLARRESRFLRMLADVDAVPADCGEVRVDGAVAPNAVARVYIAGRPLGERDKVDDEFFDRLSTLIAGMHERGVAYVDLHKRENIILGDDGRPHLIDFQVSYARPGGWFGRTWLGRGVFSELAVMDRYHVEKHVARCRPDLLNSEQRASGVAVPLSIRIHRFFAVPLRTLRRRLLVAMSVRSGSGMATSEFEPEDAHRAPTDRRDSK